jgi:tetratricopeptide (TPR) repeat protein
VYRKKTRDGRRIALPPETIVASLSTGAFHAQNPDTVLRLPNLVRKFEKGKTVKVPGNIVNISAVAKDPWDYSGVQYRFKIDEDKWTMWSNKNGMITPNILDEGVHRIQVQSRDSQGNVDPTPAEVRLSVYTREITVIKIRDGQFERIFPSQYLRYQKVGMGRVRLENTRNRSVEVDLELNIEDLFEQPARTRVKLKPREKRWVKVPAPFSDKILNNTGQRKAQAVAEAHYSFEDVERSVRRSFPVELLEANAFVWDRPARIGTFINGRDPQVERLAASLYRSFANRHPGQARASHPLRNHLLALYAFNALTELGIRYKPDPTRPFGSLKKGALDMVQYPAQTLRRRVGDCDDLTVLYASLLENLNVPTAVVPVEGHVFLIYGTGVRSENRAAFPVSQAKTIVHQGHLWIPVETTVLGRKRASFTQAWTRGAENFHGKYKVSKKKIVLVRAAWKDNPPAALPKGSRLTVSAPRLSAAAKEVDQLMGAYGARVEKLASARGNDHDSLVKRGAALAKSGLFDQALAAYQSAAKQNESYPALYGLGAVNAGQGDMLMALVNFQKALKKAKRKKDKFRSQLAIAQCYKVNGNLVKARSHLDQALKLNPAARFDSRYKPLVSYLEKETGSKSAGVDETPPFFQEILSGL